MRSIVPVLKKPAFVRNGLAAGWSLSTVNLLKNSDAANSWDSANTSVTDNVATLPGSAAATVDLVYPDSTGAYRRLQQLFTASSSTTYTLSAKVKASGIDIVTARFSKSGSYDLSCWFNLSTGAVGTCSSATTGTGAGTGGITSLGDGWYLISHSRPFTSVPPDTFAFDLCDSDNSLTVTASGTNGILIGNMQLNQGSTALPYVATTDLQSVSSFLPGTSTIVRGANTGASTDDPTPSLLGWIFDSGDRISGLPAKGDNWTVINCSSSECFAIDSAGNQYINGEPRRNLLRWSEGLDNAAWTNTGVTVAAGSGFWTITEDSSTGVHRVRSSPTVVSGMTYVLSAEVKLGTGTRYVTMRLADTFATSDTEFNLSDGTKRSGDGMIVSLVDGWYRISLSKQATSSGTANTVPVWLSSSAGTSYAGDGASSILVRNIQFNLGSTASAYQKTTDSREWALETVGNYTGILTHYLQYSRILTPLQHLRLYREVIKPSVNSKGGSMP